MLAEQIAKMSILW